MKQAFEPYQFSFLEYYEHRMVFFNSIRNPLPTKKTIQTRIIDLSCRFIFGSEDMNFNFVCYMYFREIVTNAIFCKVIMAFTSLVVNFNSWYAIGCLWQPWMDEEHLASLSPLLLSCSSCFHLIIPYWISTLRLCIKLAIWTKKEIIICSISREFNDGINILFNTLSNNERL